MISKNEILLFSKKFPPPFPKAPNIAPVIAPVIAPNIALNIGYTVVYTSTTDENDKTVDQMFIYSYMGWNDSSGF